MDCRGEGFYASESPPVSSTGCGGACQWGVTRGLPGHFRVPASNICPLYIKGVPAPRRMGGDILFAPTMPNVGRYCRGGVNIPPLFVSISVNKCQTPLSVSGLGVETVNVGKQMFCLRTGCGVVQILCYVIQIIYRPKQTNVLSPCWVSTPIINLLVTRARRVQHF
jgi:hypothetical protein